MMMMVAVVVDGRGHIGFYNRIAASHCQLDAHPRLRLELLMDGSVLDLIAENIDVALRLGHLSAVLSGAKWDSVRRRLQGFVLAWHTVNHANVTALGKKDRVIPAVAKVDMAFERRTFFPISITLRTFRICSTSHTAVS